jgi:drug/metabolite transporter (DMT)-like permease
MRARRASVRRGGDGAVAAAYLGLILIYSTTPVAIKWSVELGYLFAVGTRTVVGAVLIFAILKGLGIKIPWDRRAVATYLAAAISPYLMAIAAGWGAQFIASGLMASLFGLMPLATGLLAAPLLGERLSRDHIVASLISMAGLLVIFRADLALGAHAVAGILAVLAAVFLQALSLVLVKRVGSHLPAPVINTGGHLVASVLFALTWLLDGMELPATFSPRAAASIAYLSVFGTVIGSSLFYFSVKRLTANTVSLLSLIVPVTGLLIGVVVNGEPVDDMLWLGTGLICAGLVLQRRERRDRSFGWIRRSAATR